MLSAIREKTQGIIATFILALVAIPFALWGTYSYFEGGSELNVAKVAGVKITQQAYRLSLDRLAAGQVDAAIINRPEVKRQVLDSLIDQTLLARNGVEQGYRIGDSKLARLIRESPQFQRQDRFDQELYQMLLRREGLSEEGFEQRLRALHMTSQIQAGLSQSALSLPAEKERLLRLWQERRRFDYVLIGPDRFRAEVAVPEGEIEQYYQSHPEEFKTPEQVRIEYVRLAVADLARRYELSEQELRRAYEQEIGRYSTPEKRRLSHILIEIPASGSGDAEQQALAKARELEQQLKAGADFAELAKAESADSGSAQQGGDLGYIGTGALPRELEQAVSKLKVGEITEPVRTSYGYHIGKLTEFTPSVRKSFEEARADIEKNVRQRKGEEEFLDKVERLRNLVYEHPDNLEPAAQALELQILRSDWFGRSGGDGIAREPKVIEAAFSLEVLEGRQNSDAIELNRDTLVALRVSEHRPAALKPLAEVRAQIESRLREERSRSRAADLANEIMKEAQAGKVLADQASARGLKLEQAEISRIEPKQVERKLVAAVFKARRPAEGEQVYGQADLGPLGQAVFALNAVIEVASDKADPALAQRVDAILQRRHTGDVYGEYLARLRQTADIQIYENNL